MRNAMGLMAALLLAGCYTPGELVRDGNKMEWRSTQDAKTTADCITRGSGELVAVFTATQRGGAQPGTYEVVLSSTNGAVGIAQIAPAGDGSSVVTYNMGVAFGPPWGERMVGACAVAVK